MKLARIYDLELPPEITKLHAYDFHPSALETTGPNVHVEPKRHLINHSAIFRDGIPK
jgi:hypothetical protein